MVADAFDHRTCTGVAHGEALARATRDVQLAARRAVEDGVADEHGVPGVTCRRPHDDPAARHALPDVVVRLAVEREPNAVGQERSEALPRAAGEADPDAPGRRAAAEPRRDLAAEPRTDGAVGVADRVAQVEQPRLLERRAPRRRRAARRARRPARGAAARPRSRRRVTSSSSTASGAPARGRSRSERPTASSSPRSPRLARCRRTSSATKRRYASTCSGVAANFARSSGRCVAIPTGHVSRWHERTIRQPCAISTAVPKDTSSAPSSAATTTSRPVFRPPSTRRRTRPRSPSRDERPLRLGEPELPGRARVLDRRQRAGAGAAVRTGDVHDVGERLHDTGGDEPDAGLGDELDRDVRVRAHLPQVEDELREILDRVDVVMRRRRDQLDARQRVAQARDLLADLVRRQLPALAGLRALRDLDLQLVGGDRVARGDAEARRGDLLDARVALVAEALGILAAFARVRARAEPVERDRDGLVRLGRERAVRHAAAREAPQDRLRGLDLLERDRLCRGHELEQVAQLERLALVDELRRTARSRPSRCR